MLHGKERRNKLHAAGRADQMTDHGFYGTDRDLISAWAKNLFDDQGLGLIVQGR